MCYREEQTLDFAGMHLASLTGDNGHGKSALLDAMTWALWGKARARRDDELITLGENEMWVDFEFALGPQLYRVWRQRSKKGRGQSDLHFYIWNSQRHERLAAAGCGQPRPAPGADHAHPPARLRDVRQLGLPPAGPRRLVHRRRAPASASRSSPTSSG